MRPGDFKIFDSYNIFSFTKSGTREFVESLNFFISRVPRVLDGTLRY